MNLVYRPGIRIAIAILSLNWMTGNLDAMQAEGEQSEKSVGYDQVREVLRKRCVTCHNPDELRGDLNLASLEALLAGASSGPIVVAGKPKESLLYKSVAHLEDPAMPPNSPKIPGRELDLIRRWIEDGLLQKSGSPRSQQAPPPSISPKVAKEQPLPQGKRDPKFAKVRPWMQSTAITAMDTHPIRNIVAVPGNQQALLLDIASGKWIGALDFPEGDVTALRFSRDGDTLVVAGGVHGLSGRVVGFDLATGDRSFELADENDTILSVDLSPDRKWIALGGPNKVVRIYEVATGKIQHTLRKHTDWVLAVRFSEDGMLLASGDRFGGLFVWDPQQGQEFHSLRAHVGPVHALGWDTNNETLISAGEDGRVRTWNMHYGELTSERDGGVGAILSLANRGPLLVIGGRQKKGAVWSGDKHQLVASGKDQLECVGISADQRTIVASDATGAIRLLDGDSFQERMVVEVPIDERELQSVDQRLAAFEAEYVKNRLDSNRPDNRPKRPDPKTVQAEGSSGLAFLQTQIALNKEQAGSLREKQKETQELLKKTELEIHEASAAIQKLKDARQKMRDQLLQQETLLKGLEMQSETLDTIRIRMSQADGK